MRIDSEKIESLIDLNIKTTKDVALESGLHPQTFYRILSRQSCTPNSVMKIAAALGVDPKELIVRRKSQ